MPVWSHFSKSFLLACRLLTSVCVLNMKEEERELSGVPSIRAPIPFMRTACSRPNDLPKSSLPHAITQRGRISTYGLLEI